MRKLLKQVLILIIIIPVIVLGYGYYHSVTHASAHIELSYKIAGTSESRLLPLAEVKFMSENGDILAEGVSDEKYGHVHLIHPDAGNCKDIITMYSFSKKGKELWRKCFNKRSTWIPQWIKRVHHVQVNYKKYSSKLIPVVISKHNSEWLLWWVPLPHVGGKPYSYFRMDIIIEEKNSVEVTLTARQDNTVLVNRVFHSKNLRYPPQ